MNKNSILLLVVGLILGVGGGYYYGNGVGYTSGHQAAVTEAEQAAAEIAAKATAEAAKAANPFQAVNPLEGVEDNPFEKTKKVLNPFE
ncbi:MAG: hypothetical protein COU27_02160 [Candidatus Levybacteria bacterium CG10_big_fil_rev_8_21_14_0_10_36_7]|nr:MAG: hypothetical protein COU27_02160 [Candidatus Levybacteria bacterium CG10_big_fil_rev_8_21_14_0_10_36_7]